MAIQTKVVCDITGKEFNHRDLVNMTTVNILHNDVREVDAKDEKTGEMVKGTRVFNQEKYCFHICHEHSKDFMKHVQEFFDKKKNELGK